MRDGINALIVVPQKSAVKHPLSMCMVTEAKQIIATFATFNSERKMIQKIVLAFTLSLAAAHAAPQNTLSTNTRKIPSNELGQVILLLMPSINQKFIPWDHRSESYINWIDNGYISESRPAGDTAIRRGLVSVNILGKKSTVLRKKRQEILWTIQFESQGNPKFGAENLIIQPGTPKEPCFGSLYEGCDFEATPSLTAAGIKWKEICEYNNASEQTYIKGYELHHPDRAITHAQLRTDGGSGGSSTSFILRMPGSIKNPCSNN